MRQFAVIFLLSTGFVLHAEAQSFLDQLRTKKAGEGTVTVNQSAAIDELINNVKLTIQPQQQTTQPQRQDSGKASAPQNAEHSTATTKKEPVGDTVKEHRNTARQTETSPETTELNTTKKVPKVNRKVTGYRVQAYAGGNSRADREKAESIKNVIKAHYPELPVYVHFYSPRWICRVGNFRTFDEASSVLKDIKAMGYKQACIVKGKINVGY